jgi:serine/threonine protein phosphatase PrpC
MGQGELSDGDTSTSTTFRHAAHRIELHFPAHHPSSKMSWQYRFTIPVILGKQDVGDVRERVFTALGASPVSTPGTKEARIDVYAGGFRRRGAPPAEYNGIPAGVQLDRLVRGSASDATGAHDGTIESVTSKGVAQSATTAVGVRRWSTEDVKYRGAGGIWLDVTELRHITSEKGATCASCVPGPAPTASTTVPWARAGSSCVVCKSRLYVSVGVISAERESCCSVASALKAIVHPTCVGVRVCDMYRWVRDIGETANEVAEKAQMEVEPEAPKRRPSLEVAKPVPVEAPKRRPSLEVAKPAPVEAPKRRPSLEVAKPAPAEAPKRRPSVEGIKLPPPGPKGAGGEGEGRGVADPNYKAPVPAQYHGSSERSSIGPDGKVIRRPSIERARITGVFEVSHLQEQEGRPYQEDRTVAVDRAYGTDTSHHTPCTLFGVVDGHGGKDVAVHVRNNFHAAIAASAQGAFADGTPFDASVFAAERAAAGLGEAGVRASLFNACLLVDRTLSCKPETFKFACEQGAVAAFVYVYRGPAGDELYGVNVGDAGSVVAEGYKCVTFYTPHVSSDPLETARIERAGGFVKGQRAMGVLMPSRAFGDFNCKPWVTAVPALHKRPLTGETDFVILASDGLWDYMTPLSAVQTVYDHLATQLEPDGVHATTEAMKGSAGALRTAALLRASGRLHDNLSILVVFLRSPYITRGRKVAEGK